MDDKQDIDEVNQKYFQDLVGGFSSESEGELQNLEEFSGDEEDIKAKRKLLGLEDKNSDDSEKASSDENPFKKSSFAKSNNKGEELRVTFARGFNAKSLIEKKKEMNEETPWQKYQREKKERKTNKKQQVKEDKAQEKMDKE